MIQWGTDTRTAARRIIYLPLAYTTRNCVVNITSIVNTAAGNDTCLINDYTLSTFKTSQDLPCVFISIGY